MEKGLKRGEMETFSQGIFYKDRKMELENLKNWDSLLIKEIFLGIK